METITQRAMRILFGFEINSAELQLKQALGRGIRLSSHDFELLAPSAKQSTHAKCPNHRRPPKRLRKRK